MKPLERVGEVERAVIEERAATGYRTADLVHFGGRLEPALAALLELLLPSVGASIDLVAFVDHHAGTPLGRGDRRAGLPPEPDLYALGLGALADRRFAEWPVDDQRQLVARMRRGEADDELGVPAKDFVDRLLDKALMGYLAHPHTWARIGFTGPAFPEGYAWIGPAEAVARHRQAPGWDKL